MEPAPLYRGESVSIPANATPVAPLNNPFSELLAVGRKYGLEATEQLSDFLIDNYESSLENTRADYARQVERDARLELIRRMGITNPDDKDSFFDRNGIFKPAKAQAFISSVTSKLDGLDKGFIRPHSIANARKANAAAMGSLELLLSTTIMGSIKDRARDTFKRQFNNMMESGDYAGAAASAAGESARSILTPEEIESYRGEAERGQRRANIYNAEQNGDVAALQTVYEDENLPPDEREAAKGSLRRIHKEKQLASFQGTYGKDNSKKGTGDPVVDLYLTMRPGTPKDILDLIDKYKGVITGNGEAEQEALKLAGRHVVTMITKENDTEAVDKYKDTFKALGVNEDTLTKLANARLESVKAASTFNPVKAAKSLDDSLFVPRADLDRYSGFRNDLLAAQKQWYQEYQRDGEVSPETDKKVSQLRARVTQEQESIKKARADILNKVEEKYTEWLNEYMKKTPLEKRSPVECGSQYMAFLNEALGERRRGVQNYQSSHSQVLQYNWSKLQEDRARGAKYAAEGDEARKAKKAELEKRIQQLQEYMDVFSEKFKDNCKNAIFLHGNDVPEDIRQREDYNTEEAIVYYPKNDAPAMDVVSITYDGDKVVRAKVVKVDGIESPIFSKGACNAISPVSSDLNKYTSLSYYKSSLHLYLADLFSDDGIYDPQGETDAEEPQRTGEEQPPLSIEDEGIAKDGAQIEAEKERRQTAEPDETAEPVSDHRDLVNDSAN